MFTAAYIVILCLSAALGAWGISYASMRAAAVLQEPMRVTHGTAALCVAVAFLVVVAAPPPVMTAALALLFAARSIQRLRYLTFSRWVAPALAVGLGLTALTITPIPGFAVPNEALVLIAYAIWFGVTVSGEALPEPFLPTARTISLALLPLTGAYFLGMPSWVSLDAALILSALAGATIAAHHHAHHSGISRISFAFLTGWLMIEAALHNGWMLATASLLIWALAAAYAYAQDPARQNHAFDF